jgi:hypothetical protein
VNIINVKITFIDPPTNFPFSKHKHRGQSSEGVVLCAASARKQSIPETVPQYLDGCKTSHLQVGNVFFPLFGAKKTIRESA